MWVVAGILAKKAVNAGLTVKPFIKTSLSPGSGVVTYYLKESGVLEFMEKLGYLFIRICCYLKMFAIWKLQLNSTNLF